MKLIFFGSDIFSLPILKSIASKITVNDLIIVTRPAKPAGRGLKPQPNPVLQETQARGIQTIIVDSQKDWPLVAQTIRQKKPDFCIVAAFGKIIPPNILKLLPKRFINIHPSLLPQYRGPSPIESAILEGEKSTGVSFIILTDQMDAGPIIWQKKISISSSNAQELSDKLSKIAADNILNIIHKYQSKKIKPTPQKDHQATYTHIITKSDGAVSLDDDPMMIARKVRAYQPWPGVHINIRGRDIKIISAHAKDNKLIISKIQPPGKKIMSGREFANGYKVLLTKFPPFVKFN